MTPQPARPILEWVKRLKQYALDHYEQDGWDYLIECFNDDEIIEMIKDKPTYVDAYLEVAEVLKLKDSVRRDIQGTIF